MLLAEEYLVFGSELRAGDTAISELENAFEHWHFTLGKNMQIKNTTV